MGRYVIPRPAASASAPHATAAANTPLRGGVNLVFADGHANLVNLPRLWQLTWHKGYVPPANPPP